MKKEPVNKFDLEAAFKALDEINVPVVRGIRPNRENLQEKFTKKLVTDILVEDYYDVNDSADLEAAQEDREAEIAKAKLARIEKIVDLEAESEEDLLPSYVGKVIIQCPQCMTLFYKNQEDISKSEENPEVVNINEVCQHCGNSSGYTLIGKVDTVGEEEAEQYDLDAFEDDELNLDFPEGTEETDPEGTGEAASEEENADLDLDLNLEEPEEEPAEEEEVKEAVKQRIKLNNRSLKEAIIDDLDSALYTPGVWGVEFVGEECICFDNEQEARDYFYSLAKSDIYRDSEGIELFKVINENGDYDTIDAISIYDDEEDFEESLNESIKEDEISEEEVIEDEIEELEISYTPDGVKELAIEAGEEIAEETKENPEISSEEIEEIVNEVVDADVEEIKAETGEDISEEEVEEIEDSVVEESLNEEAPKTIAIRKPGTKDEVIEVPVVNGYAEYKDENGNIKKVPVAEALTEAKTTKQRLTVIEPGYQYKDKDGNLYTLYGEELEEDDTGITYDWEFVDDENGDIYIKLVESLTEDATKEVKIAKFGDYPVDNKKVKIAGFVDCSGSNGKDSIKNQINILKNAGVTAIYYFSDKVYTTPESAWRDGRTIYSGIRDWVENNPEAKAIVTTDGDIDFNDGHKIKNHDRIEIIRIDVKEALTETFYAVIEADGKEERIPFENRQQAKDYLEVVKQGKDPKFAGKKIGSTYTEALTEAVDKELDAKLKAHNEYIDYLKEMIEKEEKSLASAKNDFVKKSIQSRIDALKADLEAALPEALKNEVVVNDNLPTPEEANIENAAENKEETTESLKESLNEDVKIIGDLSDYSPWSGAVDTWNKIQDAGLVDDLDTYLEECYPDGLTMTELNDILWFEGEEILNYLGLGEEETDEDLFDEGCKGKNCAKAQKEPLIEADLLDAVFDSEEFNKPISDEEVRGILSSTKFHENFNLDLIEDFDENSFNKHVDTYLKEVYENVNSFETTKCEIKHNKLVVEGLIKFNSGNAKETTFVFEAVNNSLIGKNIDLAPKKAFALKYNVNNSTLFTEGLKYKYNIENTLVEGLTK